MYIVVKKENVLTKWNNSSLQLSNKRRYIGTNLLADLRTNVWNEADYVVCVLGHDLDLQLGLSDLDLVHEMGPGRGGPRVPAMGPNTDDLARIGELDDTALLEELHRRFRRDIIYVSTWHYIC